MYSRNFGNSGCPYCSGLYPIPGKNDLATTHPALIKEWDFEKNILKPFEVKSGGNAKEDIDGRQA